MCKAIALVLAGVLLLAPSVCAASGIPDPDQSYVEVDNGGFGVTTCPSADGQPFEYVTVHANRADGTPIEGISSGDFFWQIASSCTASMEAVDSATNMNGEIRFRTWAASPCCCADNQPSVVGLVVQIYTVIVNDYDEVYVNSYDEDCDGDVDPIDFVMFTADYPPNPYDLCSDFDFDGDVDPVDFVLFALHFNH
jgi:hypothetical protein